MSKTKVETSDYMDEDICKKIRALVPEENHKELFKLIDKGLEEYNSDMGYDDDDSQREPSASEEAMAMGEHRG